MNQNKLIKTIAKILYDDNLSYAERCYEQIHDIFYDSLNKSISQYSINFGKLSSADNYSTVIDLIYKHLIDESIENNRRIMEECDIIIENN